MDYLPIIIYKFLVKKLLHVHKGEMPRTQMTSIFEGQPPKTRPFPIKTYIGHLGSRCT